MSKSLSVCSSFRKSKSSLNGSQESHLNWRRFTSIHRLTTNGKSFTKYRWFWCNRWLLPQRGQVLSFFITLPVKLFQSLHVGDMFTLESRFKISVKVLVPYFEVILILYKIATFYFQRTTNACNVNGARVIVIIWHFSSLFTSFFGILGTEEP